ncbi:GntR family transcriptional regulator [Mycolicibacterium rhodesiae]|uniref:GntR family transcriptional regulator n=1 Tax=Mycolicibacterium rhodesiae TaxID=36814 RepID=A0A1X0J300_MYCRH|nr:GntR family transcriptional regulator [Mycolicibacterium rhodesiae]MCV7344685.1 GntR family transcriptional regulator [Mycolicibacterium rhodesiae]ORB55843.1 GntR family transcriptional regulator [Mycolicibacterium rhodesiae]
MNAPASTRVGNRRGSRRSQLSDEVAAHLREAIMTGVLRPGTFIRLDETAARLEVSITPVREALLTLRGEGMVALEPRRGYVVQPLSRQDIADIYWLQATIAKELVSSAADRLTDEQIDELERANEALEAAVAGGDPAIVGAAEFAFHRLLNRGAGRIKLAWFLLHAARYMPPQIYVTDPSWGAAAVDTHRRLIEALRRRDKATLAELSAAEFNDGVHRLLEQLERNGMWR